MPHQKPHLVLSLHGTYISRSQLEQDSEIPGEIWCEVTYLTAKLQWITPLPGVMWLSILNTLVHDRSGSHGCSQWLAHLHSIMCPDRSVQSGKSGLWGQRHYWLIIRPWNGTLVHLTKVVLPNSNLICCLNIPLFLSISTVVCNLYGEIIFMMEM